MRGGPGQRGAVGNRMAPLVGEVEQGPVGLEDREPVARRGDHAERAQRGEGLCPRCAGQLLEQLLVAVTDARQHAKRLHPGLAWPLAAQPGQDLAHGLVGHRGRDRGRLLGVQRPAQASGDQRDPG